MGGEGPKISVVIPTYQRLELCTRAISSVLSQELTPLEVLVCDDGSTDGTEAAIRAWSQREPRLRYLRLPSNTGSPAAVRNRGIESARGDWVAFLDDDDRWLPEKLRIQGDAISTGHYDVVASDAMRMSGGPYFGLESTCEPDRAELLRHNPIITSTAVVRRSSLVEIGGFPGSALGMSITGVEDYAAWLSLANRGARFLVLPACLVHYEDTQTERVSAAVARQEAEVMAVRWKVWLHRPADLKVLRSSLQASAVAAHHAYRSRIRGR